MSEKPEPTERPVATLPVIADLYADGRVELPPPGGRPTSDLDPYGRRRWAADDYVAQAVAATDRAADALEGGTARAADLLDEAGDRIEQATATLGAVAGSFIRPPEPTRPDGLGDTGLTADQVAHRSAENARASLRSGDFDPENSTLVAGRWVICGYKKDGTLLLKPADEHSH